MRKEAVFLLILLIPSFLCCASVKGTLSNPGEKQNGISYVCWWPGLYSLPDSDISLAQLAETGAGWISLIVTVYQENLGSTRIFASESTPTDDDLVHVIGQAKTLGLKVMLKPHLDLWNDPAHWRGEIGQAFRHEAEWNDWFASYRTFIEHYAELATAHGADQFCVGCELENTTHREADWRAIVAAVRSRYFGPLVYAGNHSGEEVRISWWDAVDIIGVDAYYPLSRSTNPSLGNLKAAWRPRVQELSALAAKWKKPLILTEIGYRSLDGASMYPWDWQIQGKVDLKEQEDCYRAALESVYREPWLAGIFWWSWSPDPFEGGPNDTGYSPHAKPAEDVLRTWFGGSPWRKQHREKVPNRDHKIEILGEGLAPDWVDWSGAADHDLEAADHAHNGRTSIRVRLDPWGAVSFRHPVLPSYSYHFLEFYIRFAGKKEPQLWVYFHGGGEQPLVRAEINDSRYIEEGDTATGEWKHVSIPLADLGAEQKRLSGFALQDRSGGGTATFWVDDVCLVGAKWGKERPEPEKRPVVR